jgi:hypothetical protein
MELLIDTIGREEEAFGLLETAGIPVMTDPDVGNCCQLPDTISKSEVEDVLDDAGIEYQWPGADEDEEEVEEEDSADDEEEEEEDDSQQESEDKSDPV